MKMTKTYSDTCRGVSVMTLQLASSNIMEMQAATVKTMENHVRYVTMARKSLRRERERDRSTRRC